MIIPLETEFNRICNLVSDAEIRRNPRVKKKLIQMKKTFAFLAAVFGQTKRMQRESKQPRKNIQE